MASPWAAVQAQLVLPYQFRDLRLLQKALTAGDTNSDDREGQRGLAQVGDALMNLIIKSEGLKRGWSRQELETSRSVYTSKRMCSELARGLRFDKLVKLSERQVHDGPQQTTLKNTMSAVVGAVWQDSCHDYDSVVAVMTSLGLINHAEPVLSLEDLTPTDLTSLSSNTSGPLDWTGGSDTTMTDFDFDMFLDSSMLGPEWISTGPCADPHSDWLAVNPFPNIGLPTASDQPHTMVRTDFVEVNGGNASSEAMNPGAMSAVQFGQHDGQILIDSNASALIAHEGANEVLPSGSQSEISGSNSRSRAAKPRRETKSTKEHEIHLAFKDYVSREAQRFQDQTEVFQRYYRHMKPYQEALSGIKLPCPKYLARIALAIGDFSAMTTLKEAIASVRSPMISTSFRVGRNMHAKERLRVIRRLDLFAAEFRIVRWLHIYYLYKDSSGGKDPEGFVNLTISSLDHASAQMHTPAQRGNPRNLERTTTMKRMMDLVDLANCQGEERKKLESSMKHLRRVGERLTLLVRRWDIGILSLLGVGFTDDALLSISNAAFGEFLEVAHRFEGESIQALSNVAASAIQLFMDDDNIAHPQLRIEMTEQDILRKLPRLSQDMQALFMPADGMLASVQTSI